MSTDSRDLYVVLGVHPTATEAEIKAAYRQLAKTYHPDLNQGDAAKALVFSIIKAAYEVLGNPQKRQDYHYARYFTLLKETPVPTVTVIIAESVQLKQLVAALDPYRVDYDKLIHQTETILNNLYINTLKANATESQRTEFIENIIPALTHIPYSLVQHLFAPLQSLAVHHSNNTNLIAATMKRKKRMELWEKYQTLCAFLIAVILCIIMYIS